MRASSDYIPVYLSERKAMLKRIGLCQDCGFRFAAESRTLCAECLRKRRENERKRKA
jgi:hypothetical protein